MNVECSSNTSNDPEEGNYTVDGEGAEIRGVTRELILFLNCAE